MEQNAFIIEQVTAFSPEIADVIRQLAKQIGHNYKELTDEDVKEMLQSSCNYLFVARQKESNQIAGMVTLLVYRIPYVKKAYFDDLVVDEAFRGHGIASLLLKKVLDVAREKSAAYVDFTSRPRRAASNTLYEKLGFKKRDTNVYRFVFDYDEV